MPLSAQPASDGINQTIVDKPERILYICKTGELCWGHVKQWVEAKMGRTTFLISLVVPFFLGQDT